MRSNRLLDLGLISGWPLESSAINVPDMLSKLPAMAFRVHTLIDAVPVELFRKFAGNLSAGIPGTLVVGFNVVYKDIESLTYFAAERPRSPARRTLGREPDHNKAVCHFEIAVHYSAIVIRHSQTYFETKSFNQPVNGSGDVIVKKMRSNSRHVVGWVWDHVLLLKNGNNKSLFGSLIAK